MRAILILFSACVAVACEPALPGGEPPVGEADAGGTPSLVVTTKGADGSNLSVINAEDSTRFTALDLETGEATPFEEDRWDLAVSRYHLRARGGASGDGGVQVAVVKDAGYDTVTLEQAGPWLEDQADSEDPGPDLDTVFARPDPWFAYDTKTHVLSPQPFVYLVKSDAGRFYKVRIEGYYDAAGTPGILTLRWAPLPQ